VVSKHFGRIRHGLVHGRPRFAKPSIHDGLKVKIAPVHSDFVCGHWPLSLMECAG
jgi:hypothetical protein